MPVNTTGSRRRKAARPNSGCHELVAGRSERAGSADGALYAAGSQLAGMVLSRLTPPDAEILTFAVDPTRRESGLGRKLLEKHLENLERRGARLVFLEVADDNLPALKIYARAGFKEIGRRENYYQRTDGSRRAAINLRLEI